MWEKPLSTVGTESDRSEQGQEDLDLPTLVHQLGNSLVPIMVHSELGLSLCEDARMRSHFEKIHCAAEQARKYVSVLRKQDFGPVIRKSE